ncbi:MAG: HDOD domain-containing protein [Desulfobacterales bacterium]
MPLRAPTALDSEEGLQQLNEIAQVIVGLLGEVSPRHREHSERVANLAAHFAESTRLLADKGPHRLYLAGLLHDVGHLGSPPEANAAESPEAEARRRRHPVAAVQALSKFRGFTPLLAAVRHHHERYDGQGYPDGKAGEAIPLEARILRLVDRWDRLTAGPGGLERRAAMERLRGLAGSELDPRLVEPFLAFLESGEIPAGDFLARKEATFIRQSFAGILQKFSSGKLVPPAMPQVVLELRNVIKRQDSSVKDLADVLEKDPVLSLRLIAVARSPVYKGYGEVKSVQAAIPRLGFKETLSIVVAIANKSLYEARHPQHRVLMDKMWVHALACAYAAKLVSQSLLLEDPESIFLMGLTHDVGKVILLRAFADLPESPTVSPETVLAAVQDAHQSVGVMLVKRWGFGEEFSRVISLHEKDELTADTHPAILAVHLANRLSRRMGFSFFEPDADEPAAIASARHLGISSEVLEKIEARVKDIVRDVAHLF